MKKTKKFLKYIIILWLLTFVILGFAGNIFAMFILLDMPEILYGISTFLVFSLIVQILFFIDIFSDQNRKKQGFIFTAIIMWIFLVVFVIWIVFFVSVSQQFVGFAHDDWKVMIFIPSVMMLRFLVAILIFYYTLSMWFFSFADRIEKKKTREEMLKLIK